MNSIDDPGYTSYVGDGPWFTTKPNGVMEPRFARSGLAAQESIAPTTLPQLLTLAAQLNGPKPAMMVERPLPPLDKDGKAPPALPNEEWTQWTFESYLGDVRKAAKGFVKLGFAPFDSVNIWGFNAPEWIHAALAANFAGGKCAGLYPTDTGDTAAYKVVHSGGSIVVIETRGQLDKLVKGIKERNDAKRIKAIVAYGFTPEKGETVAIHGCGHVPLMSWNDVLDLGAKESDTEIDSRVANALPGHCAALIYTSGTTGEPKAVMISHDNIIFEATLVVKIVSASAGVGDSSEQERILSYLPLSHVAGMMVDIVLPVVSSARPGKAGTLTYFARPYDLKAGSVKDRLCAARPTVFLGVPLVWEKIADKMRTIGAATTGAKKAVATWAKETSLARARENQLGGTGDVPWGTALSNVMLNKIKEALGLDCCKFGLTGAAPIRVDTLEYFAQLGIQINEVYGMSECTGACTWSTDDFHQWGSCGWELPGIEVKAFKIDEKDLNIKTVCKQAPDLQATEEEFMGELCWRGRGNMMGYMANPDLGPAHIAEIEQKTADTIDRDGWLHSGDKGMVTIQGMVKITGRYKELIIGQGGENIAPVPIEDSIKKLCDGIAEVMMVGDKRKYNVALITLKAVGANGESPGTDKLDAGAKRINPEVTTISAAMDDKTWIAAVQQAITDTNKNEKICINNSFSIQKFTILPQNFSQENGELTPTQKLKRKVAETNYIAMIDKMYGSKDVYVRYAS